MERISQKERISQDDAGDIKEIRLQTSYYVNRWQDEVRVLMGDLFLTATISSDRDIRLAERIAECHGIKVYDCRRRPDA